MFLFEMESEDEFLFIYFNHVSQLCYEKAKEHIEKEREPKVSQSQWNIFLNFLQQLTLAEKSYIEIGFLQNKHKSFLRKDNSLRSVYESMKNDLKKLDDNSKQSLVDKRILKDSKNIIEFLSARINLIDIYEKIYNLSLSKQLIYNDIVHSIGTVIQKSTDGFTDISMTPAKAVFSLECEILHQLFKALTELQRLQFLPSLALIHGAHTRLAAWESKIQSRETWKLGNMFKGNPLPALFQWLQQLKGAVLSKFSLYFHRNLAHQTTPNDMRSLCSKLLHDHFQKIITFQRRYDVASVILLTDEGFSNETTNENRFPVIVAFPPRNPPQLDKIPSMINETSNELIIVDRIIYKFSSMDQFTYVLTTIEPNIYLVILFESKKSEKDTFISNFCMELCQNLRCSKIFGSLKTMTK